MPTGTARKAMIATAEAMRKRVIVVPSKEVAGRAG
jgi:hypothetical protein